MRNTKAVLIRGIISKPLITIKIQIQFNIYLIKFPVGDFKIAITLLFLQLFETFSETFNADY